MPAYSEILYEVTGAVCRLTLNRPDRRNPLGPTTIGELCDALGHAQADDAVRVVVVTGAGKVFSAGGDLAQMSGGAPGAPAVKPATLPELFGKMTQLGKPIVARVNGHAMAGGLGLVVACDLAIASRDAKFGTPEIDVGLWPMMIMANIFRNAPRKRALELALTGAKIEADEAASLGLINRAVPPEELDAAVAALGDQLAAKSPAVMRLGLRAFYDSQDMDYPRALDYLQGQLAAVLGTEDAREGLMAFMQKRAPVWKGK
jgi:enoyl-CoA hydratase/carnithine racemase